MENVFNSESVQLGLEAISQTTKGDEIKQNIWENTMIDSDQSQTACMWSHTHTAIR